MIKDGIGCVVLHVEMIKLADRFCLEGAVKTREEM